MKKNAIIFGDSYSTFKGFVPERYDIWYSENVRPETDVTNVSQTWWHQVMNEANLNLVLNDSWSGSTISYTTYTNIDCSKSSSFIFRLRQLSETGFFEKNQIHTAFVFGGTNDNWAGAPMGEEMFRDWTEKDLYNVLPAVCYFLYLLRETLPEATIYCLINDALRPELTACMLGACEKYAITPVTFERLDKQCGHPTIQGMKDIAQQVLNVIKTEFK